jgi:hypothetical protein
MTMPTRVLAEAFTACRDCADEIWPGEPVYEVDSDLRCLICQAQLTSWVKDDPPAEATTRAVVGARQVTA